MYMRAARDGGSYRKPDKADKTRYFFVLARRE